MAGDMVQIHMLTSYPATLLNRDDAGLAKRVPFGGVLRTRVSSQCLKKHWREADDIRSLGEMADRSTRIYEVRVADRLVDEEGATEEEAVAIASHLMQLVDTKSEKDEPLRTGQLLVLTRAETAFLGELASEILRTARSQETDVTDAKALKDLGVIDRELKKRIKELPASIDTALFGRMVTSDYFARVDSAVSVAHAITTHEEAAETDYFTAVDTLKGPEDDAGAGLIQDTELTSGVFYLYAVVDMDQLRGNLGEQAPTAETAGRNLTRVMATTSPGAKRGSTAPYAHAEYILIERGPEQPRTLANAFRSAVRSDGADVMQDSIQRLLDHRAALAQMYGAPEGSAAHSSIHPVTADGLELVPFSDALDRIFGGG